MRLRAKVTTSVVATVLVMGLSACSEDEPAGTTQVAATVGQGEGLLNLVTMKGLVESGASDPRVDWVQPFEERTGCKVVWKEVKTAQEMADFTKNKSRRYDGISAPPEVAGQLIANGQATPVNTGLVDGYKKLEPRLRTLLKKDGKTYGVPYVWSSNLLLYNTGVLQPAPTSWAALYDPNEAKKYSQRLIVRDSPLTIAEAALYLKSKERKLKITDPYSLTRKQLDAATRVLTRQRPHVKLYWEQPADSISALAGGESVLGGVWPYQADVLGRAGKAVQAIAPSEGVTGWMTAWMIGARPEHPNCMYQWLEWTVSPDVQEQVAAWTGLAPANPQACAPDRLKTAFCNANHVGDRNYLNKVIFAHTPAKACGSPGGEEGRRDCTDYAEWTQAWIQATKAIK
ncbi:extracellular solute-binding protein [Actinomadura rudentiformis]|uniref:Extracellular solute-binding protein n=1 Tax=Actinomadura rudentiformis TaxID=359158 RepID=A0A6H9YCM5_9ACTN|nr:extracellular solute-binding protein [Actinomadura rudentiformis]KAB2341835.1 extracellular solute-binding protein [Actinomadura rudentiformis]